MPPILDFNALIDAAREAGTKAYSPYSGFRVGAAVLAEGAVFTGCNIENASFGLTMCAERVAIGNAISAGKKAIDAVAVICLDAEGLLPQHRSPCGACRQVIREFACDTTPVWIDGVGMRTVEQLLPDAFLPTQTLGQTRDRPPSLLG